MVQEIIQPFSRTKRFCCRGHEMSGDNMTRNAGVPVCRLCRNIRAKERNHRISHNITNHQRAKAEQCKRGHKFTPENTYLHAGRRICRTCKRDYKRHAVKTGAQFIRKEYRASNLKRKGVTEQQYGALLTAQGGACAICRRTKPRSDQKNFAIDHCHATGVVRGLLCSRCNMALGLLDDSQEMLSRSAAYLTNPPAKECGINIVIHHG